MPAIEIVSTSAMTRKKWSNTLAYESLRASYFERFMSEGDDSIIKVKKDLLKDAGDTINMDLRARISGDAAEGNTRIENDSRYESDLDFYTDSLKIDLRRKTVKKYGQMSDQRVPYNLRNECKSGLTEFFSEDIDQILMIYLAGARGINSDFFVPQTFAGRAGNALLTPDASHLYFGGGLSKATMLATTTMTRTEIERMAPRARIMRPLIQPVKVEGGGKKWVLVMSEEQAYDLRVSNTTNDWADISKMNGASRIYDGSLGEINNTVLHAHANVIKFNDYGAGANVGAARALFLGATAGTAAWGSATGKGAEGSRFSWNEETYDRGAGLAVTSGHIWGCKKTRYMSEKDGVTTKGDFGVIALDTSYTPLVS